MATTSIRHQIWPLFTFLSVFFAVWTLRATIGFAIDESIDGPIARAAYSTTLKFVLWVLPAASFAYWVRNQSPSRYLGLSMIPSAHHWLRSLLITGVFLGCRHLRDRLGGQAYLHCPYCCSATCTFFTATCRVTVAGRTFVPWARATRAPDHCSTAHRKYADIAALRCDSSAILVGARWTVDGRGSECLRGIHVQLVGGAAVCADILGLAINVRSFG